MRNDVARQTTQLDLVAGKRNAVKFFRRQVAKLDVVKVFRRQFARLVGVVVITSVSSSSVS